MLTQQDIHEWWEHKIENYIRNYARRNNLSLAEARSWFFSETHEIFLEAIPEALFQHINRSVMHRLTPNEELGLKLMNKEERTCMTGSNELLKIIFQNKSLKIRRP
jgi:hypothetical protein